MGIAKCVGCKTYIDDSEATVIPIDDNHSAVYCVSCAPDDIIEDDDMYAPEDDDYEY